jgi:hypothetical protein
MSSKKLLALLLIVAAALLMGSCGEGKRTAATAAVQAAQTAWETAQAELTRFLPDSAKAVEDAVNNAKAELDKKDYKGALAAATPLPDKIKALATAAEAKKEELTKNWQDMAPGMPPMLQAIKKQLTLLSIAKKLPAGLDKAKISAAQTEANETSSMWDQAKTEFDAGNIPDAVAKAQTVQHKAQELMTMLHMKAPAPPKK